MVELLFAAGTPMLLGSDEMLRTQRGNNNAYCQDNALSWFDWTLVDENADFLAFVRQCIAFRHAYPVLQRRAFFSGHDSNHDTHLDLCWFGPDLAAPAWGNQELRTLAYLLDGQESHRPGDYLIFVVLNASWNPHVVAIPHPGAHRAWARVIDTSLAAPDDFVAGGVAHAGATYLAAPRSSAVLLARPV